VAPFYTAIWSLFTLRLTPDAAHPTRSVPTSVDAKILAGNFTVPPQAFVVRGAVGHPMLWLRDLVTTSDIELVRHLQHAQENTPHRYQLISDLRSNAVSQQEKAQEPA